MSEKVTVKEIAKLWEIPETQVTCYCRNGRINSARKERRSWFIPANSKKPADNNYNGSILTMPLA